MQLDTSGSSRVCKRASISPPAGELPGSVASSGSSTDEEQCVNLEPAVPLGHRVLGWVTGVPSGSSVGKDGRVLLEEAVSWSFGRVVPRVTVVFRSHPWCLQLVGQHTALLTDTSEGLSLSA